MAALISIPAPSRPYAHVHQIRYDGEFYEDELPPELFDPEEDKEALAMFVYLAEHIDE